MQKDQSSDEKNINQSEEAKQAKPQENSNPEKKNNKAEADELSKEEKMAAEQWLRRIPDDPSGLLRRKFLNQYRLRSRPSKSNGNPW